MVMIINDEVVNRMRNIFKINFQEAKYDSGDRVYDNH